jgi:hypothetical protein
MRVSICAFAASIARAATPAWADHAKAPSAIKKIMTATPENIR